MPPALLCLSHLRWDFVYQRPNHLMARAARDRRVLFVEEPVLVDGEAMLDRMEVDGLTVVRPRVPADRPAERDGILAGLVRRLLEDEGIAHPWLWYYTPMALRWTQDIDASAMVYDCMDELSAFRGAPGELVALERELFTRADVVFTGGRSLYEAKAGHHPRVHAMPSAVDVRHFARARSARPEPPDQVDIPRPRVGYYGVIDERIDRDLIAEVARLRPDWQLVLVGPVAKLEDHEVPDGPNIHRLGLKPYAELPDYLHGWDVAMMPFAINDATRYISPTKTPEYLAGGRPVVSTPVRDVVQPYGDLGLVRIAETAPAFVAAIEAALGDDPEVLAARADGLLAEMSWDATWARMHGIVRAAIAERTAGVGLPEAPARSPSPAASPVPTPSAAPLPVASARAGTTGEFPQRRLRVEAPTWTSRSSSPLSRAR